MRRCPGSVPAVGLRRQRLRVEHLTADAKGFFPAAAVLGGAKTAGNIVELLFVQGSLGVLRIASFGLIS